jgi:DNA-binding MarR family transcriptional regulator
VTDSPPDPSLAPLPGSPTPLDDKLVAALERVGQALRVQMWDRARRHGLSPTQLQVLLRLAAGAPAQRRVGVLAAELDVTHPTVSDAVAVLRRKGLLEREGGKRTARLALSARGRGLADELADWHERTLRQLTALPADDKEQALRVLLELIAGLQRSGAITVARMCVSCRFFRRDEHAGSARPHHCALVGMPLADAELRVDCAEHEPLAAA